MSDMTHRFEEAFTRTCIYCYITKIKYKGDDNERAWKEGICDECREKHPVRMMECRKCDELFPFRWVERRNGDLRPKLLCPKCTKIEWERYRKAVRNPKPEVVKLKVGEVLDLQFTGPEIPLFDHGAVQKNHTMPFDEQDLDRACLSGLLKKHKE